MSSQFDQCLSSDEDPEFLHSQRGLEQFYNLISLFLVANILICALQDLTGFLSMSVDLLLLEIGLASNS